MHAHVHAARRRPSRPARTSTGVAGPPASSSRGGERRRRVARRERAGDRPAHAVGQRSLGGWSLGGAHPAEAPLDRAVGERATRRRSRRRGAARSRGSPARAARLAPIEQPQQPVVGRARQAVEDGVEPRAPDALDARVDPEVERVDPASSIGRGYRPVGAARGRRVSWRRRAEGQRQRRRDHGARAAQLGGVDRVAAVRGAVRLERAEVAEAPGCGRKSSRSHAVRDRATTSRRSCARRRVIDCSVGVAMIASGFER